VPANVVLPHLVYRDVAAAITWLTEALGFREQYRYGNPVDGAQVRFGELWIMLERARDRKASPAEIDCGTQYLTVFVDDLEAHYEKAKSAGARIVEKPHETIYGEFQYVVEDCEGHRWLFSRHARDVSPDAWGAVLA
jgi:uncharacterized glyoxalase superfamily protein PhnB